MLYRGHLAFVLRALTLERVFAFLYWIALVTAIAWFIAGKPALAHDPDDPAMDQFYEGLKQPDTGTSCCGRADAYQADQVKQVGQAIIAIITDTRDDVVRGRRHIEPGTEYVIPRNKIRVPPAANPTGHTIIFIDSGDNVLCYEPAALS
jgi:hypothetical protein